MPSGSVLSLRERDHLLLALALEHPSIHHFRPVQALFVKCSPFAFHVEPLRRAPSRVTEKPPRSSG